MDFLQNHKKIVVIAAILFCLVLMILTINRHNPTVFESALGYVVTPLQSTSTRVSRWFEQKLSFLTSVNETEQENLRLKEELARLKADYTRIELVEKENERLSALLEIGRKYAELPTVGAEIIGKDIGNWYTKFVINKGTRDGIQKNMAVLGEGGLLGRIVEAGGSYAKVVTLIDDSSSVGAKSVRTDDIGYVKGDIDGYCRMEYISADAQIMKGDEIITSQLSDIYPPGITIGYVEEIRPADDGLTKYAIIKPVVNFKRMETVLVVNQVYNKSEVEDTAPPEE